MWHLAWEHQWALNAWPNVVITAVMIGVALYWSWRHGYSPLEIVSVRANEIFVETIRKRFPVERSETRKT